MADILPPLKRDEKTTPVPTELGMLAEFIRQHGETPFDHHLYAILDETSQVHTSWAQQCKVAHWDTDLPCDEYERGLSLAIAWLKSRILGAGA